MQQKPCCSQNEPCCSQKTMLHLESKYERAAVKKPCCSQKTMLECSMLSCSINMQNNTRIHTKSKHGKTLSIFSGSSSFNPIVLFVSSSKQVTIATYSFISNLFCNFIFVGSSKVIHRIYFLLLMQGTNLVAFNR